MWSIVTISSVWLAEDLNSLMTNCNLSETRPPTLELIAYKIVDMLKKKQITCNLLTVLDHLHIKKGDFRWFWIWCVQ